MAAITDLLKLYYSFWNSVPDGKGGVLSAWPEDTVPTNTPYPYITYTLQSADFWIEDDQQVRVWTNSESWTQWAQYCDAINAMIPVSGKILTLPNSEGGIYVYRGSPFIQNQTMDVAGYPNLKVAYINVTNKFYIV